MLLTMASAGLNTRGCSYPLFTFSLCFPACASSSRWPGEIVLSVWLGRGGGQRRQHSEFPPAAAAAREAVFAGETLQTLEVEEEEDQRQVPGPFQR